MHWIRLIGMSTLLVSCMANYAAMGQSEDAVILKTDAVIRARFANIQGYTVTEHYAVYRNGSTTPSAEKTVPLRSLSEQRARADGWGEKFLGSNAKQLGYELRLCPDITLGYPSYSSLSNHVDRFDSFQGSPRALKRTVAVG
jgi:hypothetical protein